MADTLFSQTQLSNVLVDNLKEIGYQTMTPIQAQTLPPILDGKDVIGQGKTGSGKTAAFGLGILHNLNVKRFRIQSLVLCPTRELADQVAKEIRKLARAVHNIKVLTLCGGTPLGPQIGSLEHGAHIIVGTPGRIEDHLGRGRLDLSEVNTIVLDEADRMLEMGFQATLDYIFSKCPSERQTLLFSATFPEQIEKLAKNIMSSPISIKVESTHDDNTINQHFFEVNHNDRFDAVELLLMAHQPESTVIFCNTKIEVQEVADKLINKGYSCMALHGDLEQRERDQTLVMFANKSISVLVATDVASRGLDIDNLDAVINFQLAHDPEIHVHRIGRTGRAGGKGIACTIFSAKEAHKVIKLEDYLGQTITPESLPDVEVLSKPPTTAEMVTIQIDGGKKQKVRAGDILGALTAKKAIDGKMVGKIQLFDIRAYVAVHHSISKLALKMISEGKMKGRNFRARIIN
ncbi:MAG: ATP-dependent RNA helicase DbpA [Thalassotalea sp.]